MPHGVHAGGAGEPDSQGSCGENGDFRNGGVSAGEPCVWSHGPRGSRTRMAQMSRFEDMNAMSDSCDEAASWHARWQDAAERGLSPEEVDRWAQWSRIPENKRAYDAVEFVARAKYALEPPPLPTPEELAADDSDG